MAESVKEYLGAVIDKSRDSSLPEQGLVMLTSKGFYKKEWEESPQESFARAATCYSFGDYEFAQRIYDYVSKEWFMYASPVLTNAVEINWPTFGEDEFEEAGNWLEENVDPEGMPISCFLTMITDSKEGLTTASDEAKHLSMMGGGVGIYAANRSPDEKSTGVMSHAGDYDNMTVAYRQTASRRGSMAMYLDIDHPEIIQFLEMRNPVGGTDDVKCFNLNHGVNITDDFMKAVIADKEYELVDPKHGNTGRKLKARDVWERILELRYETGEPYLLFVDTVNRNLPKQITKPTYRVSQSNLCVAPETQVLTKNGYVPISELEDCNVEIWNGEEWSEVCPTKTGENQKLLKVTTSAGQVLECTDYHKWYVFTGYGKPYCEKRTYELRQGDKLIKFDLPIIEGDKELENAYDNGFFSGDGFCSKGHSYIYLYADKKELTDKFSSVASWSDQPESNRLMGKAIGLKEKFFVPTNEYSVNSRLKWLAGYLDADGCIYRNGTNEAITASSVNFSFLQEVQLMLQTLGVSCKISKLMDAGMRPLPANDGSGENKEFYCQDSYRLLITSYDSFKLLSLGLQTHRLKIKLRRPQRDAKQFNQIVSVVDEGRFDDTYCFNETKRHMGMFNGILTGNCSEITLMTSAKRSAVCCLSSLNLEKYDEWKDTNIVQDLVRFLDNVLEYFIRLAPPTIPRAVYSASKERAIGLGKMGWHSYLQKNMIPFESGGFNSAVSHAHMLGSIIKERAEEESKRLAKLRGEAPDCAGSGYRNSHLLATAPNASSSSILGTSPSCEPWNAPAFVSQGRAGSFLVKNKYLKEVLAKYNLDTEEVWLDIVKKESVQWIDQLTDTEKAVFKTAREIDPMWVIELTSVHQQYTCQSISTNLFWSSETEFQQYCDVHITAWVKGLKSLYYSRGQAPVKADVGTGGDMPLNAVKVKKFIEYNQDECLSCHG